MQMYVNDDNENEKHEKKKKRHRKPREENVKDVVIADSVKPEEYDYEQSNPVRQRRRSEEENYEPSNEAKHKHRHRRSKTEERRPRVGETNSRTKNENNGRLIVGQEEEIHSQRNKVRHTQEKRKTHEDIHMNVQSPLSDHSEYDMCDQSGTHIPDLERQINEFEPELVLREYDAHAISGQEPPKPKKKKGGFAKIFASLKKKNKSSKPLRHTDEHCQSNPELFNPTVDSQPATLERAKKKIRGKSARDLIFVKAHVILLDGEEVEIEMDLKATGSILFLKVCDDLELIERDFFGLTYVSSKLQTWFWLEMDKKVSKQLGKDDEWIFNFQVKFYPPEPLLLQENITRYLLSLQIRQDVYTGKLPCSWITQALLGSFMVQSELGDYDQVAHGDNIEYLREFEFVLNQSEQLLDKICELHKKHVGMLPDRADIKYMETAKRLEQYGVDLHPARDNDNVEIFIGVSYQGILIYRDRVRIGRFAWPKVIRISYKKNYFYLKICSERYDDKVAIVGFKLFNHHLAKRLWKIAAEQHTFFRMKESKPSLNRVTSNASSSSGYSCKTLHQYRSLNILRDQPVHFDRTISKRRTIGSLPAGLNQTGLQYSSMHSLNRVHPRDMALGKTRSVEHLNLKKPGSTIGAAYDTEGSLGSIERSRPAQAPLFRPFGAAHKDDERHQSFRSGDSLNGGDSYTVNNDDQMSLPSIPPTRDRVPIVPGHIKQTKSVPLSLPPDSSDSSSDCDVTDSIQKPPFKFQPRQTTQTTSRTLPQYRPPPPLPDPIPEPPSASSSVGSSPTGHSMPPPPPQVDMHSMADSNARLGYPRPASGNAMDQSRLSERQRPMVKPKPNVAVKERLVITKTPPRKQDDGNRHDDML